MTGRPVPTDAVTTDATSTDAGSTDAGTSGVVGYASGVFDMFHIGHLNLLRRAREECDVLVVGVGSDEYIEGFKGRRPIVPLSERLEIVAALGMVDEVVVDESSDKLVAWRSRPFDVIFKGDDWRGTPKGEALEEQMASVGARVVYFPYTLHTSSSKLRAFVEGRERA